MFAQKAVPYFILFACNGRVHSVSVTTVSLCYKKAYSVRTDTGIMFVSDFCDVTFIESDFFFLWVRTIA